MQTEVEIFQSSHRNHLGRPLKVDGLLGPETRWSMDFASLSQGRQLVILEAQPYIGLEEYPPRSNSDPKGIIEGWLKRCHAQPGEPWCASALCAWLSATVDVRIAGAQNLGRNFPAVSEPWAGDIGWYPTDDHGHGHCFLIIGVSPTEVMTIEGNCDNAVRCVRRARTGLRFARVFKETMGRCPGVIGTVLPAGKGTR